jgi:hypothetical protein
MDGIFTVGILFILLLALIVTGIRFRQGSQVPKLREMVVTTEHPTTITSEDRRSPDDPAASPVPVKGSYTGPTSVDGGMYLYSGRYGTTDQARIGREGEERVVEQLMHYLDARWFIFRNVVLPGNSRDLDVVLVGPGGTWVLEVKTYTGNYRVENGRWYRQTSSGHWAHMQFGPGAQAVESAKRLCNFLKQSGITKGNAVNRAVVVAQDTSIDFVSAGTEVWTMQTLPGRVTVLRQHTFHRTEHVQRIATALMRNTGTPAVMQ